MTNPVLGVVRLDHGRDIDLPAYETPGAAGMDLRAAVPAGAPLVLAPGTASGYKRIKKIDATTFAAYRTVGGRQQHVWTSEDPRECAYVLAWLELEPLSEEEIKTACKAAAKERAQLRAAERKRAEVSRRIHALYMERIVKPKRAQEARQRARMEEKACRDREADEWYASL